MRFIFATQNYTDAIVVRAKNRRIRIEIFVADRAFGVSLVLIINQDLIFIINE